MDIARSSPAVLKFVAFSHFRLLILTAATLLLLTGGCARLEPAADFEVTLFDGERFKLSEEAGRNAVVVNFWYPSCAPCREEMPHFESAWRESAGQDVRFLGLFVPMGFDSEQDARDFVAELGLTFDFAVDPRGTVAQSYEVEFFPTTYFINREGRVFRVHISNLDREAINDVLADMG